MLQNPTLGGLTLSLHLRGSRHLSFTAMHRTNEWHMCALNDHML
jgi:hypothetical protein